MTEAQERATNLVNRFVSVGIILTCSAALLYVVDEVLRNEQVVVGVLIQLVMAAAYTFILLKVRKRRNWARRVFIILFVLLSVPFIPAIVASSQKGILYSSNSFLAALQRVANLGHLVFEAGFVVYLFKPSVRALFSSAPPKVS